MNFTRRTFLESIAATMALRPAAALSGERPIIRFGVLSDTHIRAEPGSTDALRKQFARFSREGVRAVVISGDLCEIGTLTELKDLMAAWNDSFPGGLNAAGEKVEPIIAFGNHDYHAASWMQSNSVTEQDMKLGILYNKDAAWRMITGRSFEGEIYRRDIGGVTFIAAHWGHFDRELADWLEAHKAEIPTDRPVFFVQHSHPRRTCFAKWYTASSAENLAALMKHPNFFVFSGHSHISNSYDDAIWLGGFVSMAAGCSRGAGGRRYEYNVAIKPAMFEKMGTRHMAPQDSGGAQQSTLVSVYPSRVVVSRWDHKFDDPIGEDWDIPFPFRHDKDHPFPFAESAAAPEFMSGAGISVEVKKGLLYPTRQKEDQVRFTFPCASSVGPHSRVIDYKVEIVRAADGSKVIDRLVAQNHIALAEKRTLKASGLCVFGKDELPSSTSLRVRVTPLNAGGKGGKFIEREFTV